MNFSALKQNAKAQIKGNIGILFVCTLIYVAIIYAASLLTMGIGTIVLMPPLTLGYVMIFIGLYNNTKPKVADIFGGFKSMANAIILYILTAVFTALWSLLLVIPGIIKSYSYSMAFYILADNPQMSASDALNESKRIMNGHKMELFVLQLSFIGWFLLTAITFGIAGIYVAPYMSMTMTNFYKSIIGQSETYEGQANEYANASPEL